jgi:hypothetical protein
MTVSTMLTECAGNKLVSLRRTDMMTWLVVFTARWEVINALRLTIIYKLITLSTGFISQRLYRGDVSALIALHSVYT